MSVESGPRGYEEPVERVELPYGDETLKAVVLDPELEHDLYNRDPVL